MYLSKIVDRNLGPINNIHVTCPFSKNGNPLPIVFVGENGSGKSTIISNIVDALYEMVGSIYDDARIQNKSGAYSYYKTITPTEISIGTSYMFSCVEFITSESSDNRFAYIFKSAKKTQSEIEKHLPDFAKNITSNSKELNAKSIKADSTVLKKDIDSTVICYFPPNRYERPIWLGDNYYLSKTIEHINIRTKFSNTYDKPILIEGTNDITLQWLLDIIVDSRFEVIIQGDSLIVADPNLVNIYKMRLARENIEKILSIIIGHDIVFGLNHRNFSSSRFDIRDKTTNSIMIPSLSGLSSGQAALFTIFATIVRYADYNFINNSIELDQIAGVVVIDEIDLHLHTNLQRFVLPKLIKLFPKIQFIITTHSPLFLLGMDEYIGSDNYDILQMPLGEKISSEAFSEFETAYSYYSKTDKHRKELVKVISEHKEKPLIITEGSTDWKHLKAALCWLCTNEETSSVYSSLDFEFLEYEPVSNGVSDDTLRLEMGDSQLTDCCKSTSLLPQSRKIIFIADADNEKTKAKLTERDSYKSWGNNVYSFVIPIPQHRATTPNICIEHYYKDDEIKTLKKISGIDRRLYIGNEFDSSGISSDKMLLCHRKDLCGESKISIIDGSSGAKVIRIHDDERHNLALSKADFANAILNKEDNFGDFDFSEFQLIFNIIKDILALPNA